jgi:hypothetical protein
MAERSSGMTLCVARMPTLAFPLDIEQVVEAETGRLKRRPEAEASGEAWTEGAQKARKWRGTGCRWNASPRFHGPRQREGVIREGYTVMANPLAGPIHTRHILAYSFGIRCAWVQVRVLGQVRENVWEHRP